MTEPVKLIIDCDVGVDDAQAILLALSVPHVEVLAITCVAGNVGIDKVCVNTLKVLEACDRLDIPVYKGAVINLLGTVDNRAEFYHGQDGLGDVQDNSIPQPDLNLIKKEVAAVALVRMVNERPGEISIAAIGPLTNVALAMKLDPNFTKKVKEIVIMGGDLEGKACGHLTTEFNFTCDPEAVHIVLNESQCPIVIVPFEVTRKHGFSYDFLDDLISRDSKKARFVKAITTNCVEKEKAMFLYTPCDLYALAYLVDKSCVVQMEHVHVQIELHGSLTRGKMIPDWNKKVSKNHKMHIIVNMDMDKLKELFSNSM